MGFMVHQTMFFFFSLFVCLSVQAQDERYYRQILSGELPKLIQDRREVSVAKFNVAGPEYKFDLNDDKIEETLQSQKRDGVDWLEIRNASGSVLYEAKLLAMGAHSSIYKLKVVNLSKTLKAVVIFLDEGQTQGKRFESTARIYVLSFENNDLGSMVLTEGPHFFHEKEAQREQYWRRDLAVNIFDLDGNGIREISVQYNHIQRIMKYAGKGIWERY
jgi:hypothetical protein